MASTVSVVGRPGDQRLGRILVKDDLQNVMGGAKAWELRIDDVTQPGPFIAGRTRQVKNLGYQMFGSNDGVDMLLRWLGKINIQFAVVEVEMLFAPTAGTPTGGIFLGGDSLTEPGTSTSRALSISSPTGLFLSDLQDTQRGASITIPTVNDGLWHHYRLDGKQGSLKGYMDGNLLIDIQHGFNIATGAYVDLTPVPGYVGILGRNGQFTFRNFACSVPMGRKLG